MRSWNPSRRVVLARRLAVFAAAVLLYLLLLHVLRYNHFILIAGLLFQYAVLLPCLIWALKGLRGSGERAFSLPALGAALMLGYLVLAIPLSRHEYNWPANPIDESCYSFQARIFRSGHIVADPLIGASDDVKETPPEVNYQNHILTPSGWYTHFPPGWPALLMLGQWLGASWVLDPLLGFILLGLTFIIARETFSVSSAHLAVLMAVLSPFFLINAIRQLSHMFCAVLIAGACWLVLRGLARKQIVPIALAFAVLVLAFQVRPYTAFAESLVLGGAALWYSRNDRKFSRQVLIWGIFATVAVTITMMAYDYGTTGDLAVSPYAARSGSRVPNELTFSPHKIVSLVHQWGPTTFTETMFSTFPFLFLLGAYAVWQEKEKARETRILACVFAVVPLAYLLHTGNSYSYFGSRFHFEGFFAAAILAARGGELLAQRWAVPRRAAFAVLGLLVAMQISDVTGMVRSLRHVNAPYHQIRTVVAQLDGRVPLVFLRDGPGYKVKYMNFNHGDWRHSTVYLIDAEPEKRDDWACKIGRSDWVAISLGNNGNVEEQTGHSNCSRSD